MARIRSSDFPLRFLDNSLHAGYCGRLSRSSNIAATYGRYFVSHLRGIVAKPLEKMPARDLRRHDVPKKVGNLL